MRAEDLRVHFKRWVGLPEHDWLGANRRIQTIEALDLPDARTEMATLARLREMASMNKIRLGWTVRGTSNAFSVRYRWRPMGRLCAS